MKLRRLGRDDGTVFCIFVYWYGESDTSTQCSGEMMSSTGVRLMTGRETKYGGLYTMSHHTSGVKAGVRDFQRRH